MKKLILVGAILVGAVTASQAGVSVNFGIGLPLPHHVVIGHRPPVCAPPVVVAPRYCPPPRAYCPPPVVYHTPRYYGHGYYGRGNYGHGYRHGGSYGHGYGYRGNHGRGHGRW